MDLVGHITHALPTFPLPLLPSPHALLSGVDSSPEEAFSAFCTWTRGTLSPFPSLKDTEAVAESPAAPGRKEAMLEKGPVRGGRA